MKAIIAHRRIFASLVAKPEEMARAESLLAASSNPDAEVSNQAADELVTLAEVVKARETGRSLGPLIPDDPTEADAAITGLKKFTETIKVELDAQIKTITREHRTWLAVAVVVVALPALLFTLGVLLGTPGIDALSSIAASAAALLVPALAVAVMAFRVFQVRDETSRRLREKRISLEFLEAALSLSGDRPELSPVLERSFNMFLQHYEDSQSPLSVSDIATSTHKR